MNTKADILSRKEQVNTKEDNKDVQLLKDNLEEQHKREGNYPSIGKERWISMERRWNGIHGRKDLCAK